MKTFKNKDGKSILMKMVKEIQNKKAYLSEVDGLIGDGDHGMNMNKGFSVFEKRFENEKLSFSIGLYELGMILLNEIGGSMGPIYGTILMGMSDSLEDSECDNIGLSDFAMALENGLCELYNIVDARVGDKTLVDTLAPAVKALKTAQEQEADFCDALNMMKKSAQIGCDSTKDLIAKYGRSSRLGKRSKGVMDAGACSCYIIIEAMANGIIELL